jgi:YidC/Oxa1 family membrane protein insertase
MKKFLNKETAIIAVLLLAMMAWGPVYQKFLAPPPGPVQMRADTNAVGQATTGVETVSLKATPASVAVPENPPTVSPAEPELRPATQAPRPPEQTATLSNSLIRLTLSSWGGGITAAVLPNFSMTQQSPAPAMLDFAKYPALAYQGLAGVDADANFTITVLSNGAAARLEAEGPDGLRLVRLISLGARYEVKIEDTFVNAGAVVKVLPAHSVSLGEMGMLEGESHMSGLDSLAIDTLTAAGGESVRHWASKRWFSDDLTLGDYFQEDGVRGHGCVGRPKMTRSLPLSVRQPIDHDLDWVAVKNKFFVQIFAPVESASGCTLIAHRKPSEREVATDSRTWDSVAVLSGVAADVRLPERALAPGDSYRQAFSYYVGPKELSSIKPLGRHMKEVMDFGTLKWLCEGLVWSLKGLHAVIPNYGIAIILLTLIVRIVFWPLTHKGTESMKRMQELQPKLKELQEKYRDKPQKLQQETMAMYRENKVNPLGGCLPMLIQIPVFFALFNVLRSAIELRFAGFLWVADLSAPENLFAGMLPFGLALNILPLIMAATQAWQQHLTPTAGDPAQQKMMMFMPVIMLMFLYSMPSALVLYWTANQVLMIIQLLWQKRAKAKV